jgi:putative ABC transport system ATP-binding protein
VAPYVEQLSVAMTPAVSALELYRFFHVGDTEVRALRGASLIVGPAEVVALVGPSGSGKSTLLACIAGLDEPDGGRVVVAGHRMTRRPEAERARLRARHVGVLQQSNNLFDHLTVGENIRLSLELARSDRAGRSRQALASVGLADRARALPSELSGGEGARAALAVALAADPAILIADEPTAEVDVETERQLIELIAGRKYAGRAALIATHSMALAARADRVYRIADGRIVGGQC